MAAKDQKKLSGKDKQEIMRLYFDDFLTQDEIAERYGVSQKTISLVVNDVRLLREYDKKEKAAALRSKIKLACSTELAVDEHLKILKKDLRDELLYLKQNSARDILDRAGIRAKDESKQDVNITFGVAGMPKVNMPDGGDEDADDQS